MRDFLAGVFGVVDSNLSALLAPLCDILPAILGRAVGQSKGGLDTIAGLCLLYTSRCV